MALVKYGIKTKKPEAAIDLPLQAKKHITETNELSKIAKLSGAQYGKAVVKSDPSLQQN